VFDHLADSDNMRPISIPVFYHINYSLDIVVYNKIGCTNGRISCCHSWLPNLLSFILLTVNYSLNIHFSHLKIAYIDQAKQFLNIRISSNSSR
jgi:hypothetical protein